MGWEIVPFQVAVPVIPEFAPAFEPRAGDKAMPVVAGHTGEIRFASIEETTNALLRSYRRRVDRGDRRALGELLDLNPAFISVEWVAEAVARYAETELSIRRTGRPRGTCRRSPLFVVGLVEHLIRTKRAKNLEQVFHWFEEHEVLSYGRVKTLYYQERNDPRVRAVLINQPVGMPFASDEQVQVWLAEAGWPSDKPGAIIARVGVVVRNRRPGPAGPSEQTLER